MVGILHTTMHGIQPFLQVKVSDLVAGSAAIGPQIQVPFRPTAWRNSSSQFRSRDQNKISLMLQSHENEHPELCLALPDFFRVERVPARGENIARQFLVNIEAARELHLHPDRLAVVSFASDEQVHPTVLRRYPDVIFAPKLSVDVVPDQELAFVDCK